MRFEVERAKHDDAIVRAETDHTVMISLCNISAAWSDLATLVVCWYHWNFVCVVTIAIFFPIGIKSLLLVLLV